MPAQCTLNLAMYLWARNARVCAASSWDTMSSIPWTSERSVTFYKSQLTTTDLDPG
jgi:hypothetical protein